jgi:hypothetical protein
VEILSKKKSGDVKKKLKCSIVNKNKIKKKTKENERKRKKTKDVIIYATVDNEECRR